MAASILQSSFLPSLCSSSSSSSSSSTKLLTNLNTKSPVLVTTSPLQRLSHHHHQSKRNLVLNSTTFEAPVLDDFLPSSETSKLKFKLLSTVSGLNRGLAADENDLEKANTAAKELEAVGGLVDFSESLDKLQGRWKLIYSSAFSSRTLGGSRPGPPIGRLLPITLGQVFQRIDIYSKDFDNIVELQLGTPWPLPPVEVKATLAHKFELVGSSRIKIVYQKTTVKTTGNLAQLPPLEIPQLPEGLRPSSNRGTGDFEVTYQDADTRLTRGDRGELRVFVIA